MWPGCLWACVQNVSRTQPTRGIVFKSGPGPCVGYIAGLLGCTWPNSNGQKNVPNAWNGTPKTDEEMRAVRKEPKFFPSYLSHPSYLT